MPLGAGFEVRVDGSVVGVRSGGVAVSGRTVTLTLASTGEVTHGQTVTITYNVALAGNPLQDLAGNDAAGLTNRAVTNNTPAPDTSLPSLVSAAVNGFALVLTYDEALDPGSVPLGAGFEVRVDGSVVGVRSGGVAVSGRTVTLTLASTGEVTHGQTVTITYNVALAGNPLQDLAGNDAAGLTNRAVTNNTPAPDTSLPSLVSAAVNGATLVLTYDDALDEGSVPAAGSFAARLGSDTRPPSTVAVSGRTVTLTLATAATHGQAVEITYSPSGTGNRIRDLAGNDADALTNRAVTNNTPAPDTTAPVLVSATVNGFALVLTYDEALDPGSVPLGAGFEVRVDGSVVGVRSDGVAVSGRTVTLTLASTGEVTHGQTVTITYNVALAGNPLQDLAGNDAAGLTNRAVTNNTPLANQVTGVEVTPGVEQLAVRWDALAGATGYKVQWKSGTQSYDPATREVEVRTTRYTLPLMTPGTAYTLQVIATLSGDSDGPPSREATGTPTAPALARVTNVRVTPGAEELRVRWGAVLNAEGYVVQWKSGGERYSATERRAVITSATTSHPIADLTPGTAYTVRVYATRAGADDGPPSAGATSTPAAVAPAQVTNVRVTAEVGALRVRWDRAANADGYVVQWKSGTQSYSTSVRRAVLGMGNETGYTIAGLAGGTTYTVRITATRAGADDGPPSAEATGTPQHPAPARVTGLTVTPGAAHLAVSWTAVSDAGGYVVQWKSGTEDYSGTERRAVLTSGTTTSNTIAGLAGGTTYTVRVYATRAGAADGAPSAEATGRAASAGVTVTAADPFTVPEGASATYEVVLDARPASDVVIAVGKATGGSADVTFDTDAGTTGEQATLTFTPASWNAAQTVTVSAAEDDDAADDTATLTHAVVGRVERRHLRRRDHRRCRGDGGRRRDRGARAGPDGARGDRGRERHLRGGAFEPARGQRHRHDCEQQRRRDGGHPTRTRRATRAS